MFVWWFGHKVSFRKVSFGRDLVASWWSSENWIAFKGSDLMDALILCYIHNMAFLLWGGGRQGVESGWRNKLLAAWHTLSLALSCFTTVIRCLASVTAPAAELFFPNQGPRQWIHYSWPAIYEDVSQNKPTPHSCLSGTSSQLLLIL